jgi:hypothetical protein
MKNHQVMVLLLMCLLLMLVSCQTSSNDLIENLNSLFFQNEISSIDFYNISPDGRYIAQENQEDQIVIRSTQTREIIASSNFMDDPNHEVYISDWSPDSSMMLAFSGRSPQLKNTERIIILNLSTNNELIAESYRLSKQVHPSVSWSPDSKKLVVSEGDRIYVINSDAEFLFDFDDLPGLCYWVEWGNNGIYAGFESSDPELGMFVFFLGDDKNNSPEHLFTSEYGPVFIKSDSVEKKYTLFSWLDRGNGFAYFLVDLDEDHSITELSVDSRISPIASDIQGNFEVNDKYQPYVIVSNDEWYVFSWDEMEFIFCGHSNFDTFKYNPSLEGFLVIINRTDKTEPYIVDFVTCQP